MSAPGIITFSFYLKYLLITKHYLFNEKTIVSECIYILKRVFLCRSTSLPCYYQPETLNIFSVSVNIKKKYRAWTFDWLILEWPVTFLTYFVFYNVVDPLLVSATVRDQLVVDSSINHEFLSLVVIDFTWIVSMRL